VLDVPGWPGHLAGQHVDIRLTAPDGYIAERSYSIASAPGGERLELTIQRIGDGEVSPYLTDTLSVGDPLELRGPIGGWFVWNPESTAPVLLVAGGSGLVPLMAMIRNRADVGSKVPFRLIYSVRTPADALYAAELAERKAADSLGLTYVYTRVAPPDAPPPGRINASIIASADYLSHPPQSLQDPQPAQPSQTRQSPQNHQSPQSPQRPGKPQVPAVFVCGPTPFVEAAARLLVDAGHNPATVKTERFGPTGT
jgi:ferredoxin-NADP reductase